MKGVWIDVYKVLVKMVVEKKVLNLCVFKDGECVIVIYVVDLKRRVICSALVYCTLREEMLSVVEVYVWVYLSVKELVLEVFCDVVVVWVVINMKVDVEVEESDVFARIEIIGVKVFEIV